MNPEPTAEGQQPAPETPSKGKLKLILIVVVLVLLLGGGGAAAYFKFLKAPAEGESATAHAVEPVFQEMDTFLVNLSDPGGKRFLKLTMKAKMDGKDAAAEFVGRNFEMRDIVLMLLSGKEFADIARPEDKAILKQELLAILNRNLQKGQVMDIYFTEFLVQ